MEAQLSQIHFNFLFLAKIIKNMSTLCPNDVKLMSYMGIVKETVQREFGGGGPGVGYLLIKLPPLSQCIRHF